MPLFAAKGMSATGGGGNFYTLLEAKRATKDDSSYRQPTGMYDVAASSSGEIYTLNGERNPLTGLYNAVVAKIGAIGAVSWQYTISSAKNVYPCALACNTNDNSIFVCTMETTAISGSGNYSAFPNDIGSAADKTDDVIYHFVKFNSSGARVWENIWSSSNPATYPGGISQMRYNVAGPQYAHTNVFSNRNSENYSEVFHSLVGAPDLTLNKCADNDTRDATSIDVQCHPTSFAKTDAITLFGDVLNTEPEIYGAYSIDGPKFGGRPQSTSNIAIDTTNEYFYILVAANSTTSNLSDTRNTMQVIRIPFSGTNVNAREITYPGGWDQNAKITLDANGKILIPWTSTNKEISGSPAGPTDVSGFSWRFAYMGTASVSSAENQGAFIRLDWSIDNDYEFTNYNGANNVPCKVAKVEPEPVAQGTTFEYVTTAGLTPNSATTLGGLNATRTNRSNTQGLERRMGFNSIGRYQNFVGLHKKNIATNAIDWARTFFAVVPNDVRDSNNSANSLGLADIFVSESKVFSNGIYYVGNVAMRSKGSNATNDIKINLIGFIAKVKFDGTVDYIREVRSLFPDIENGPQPHYYYQAEKDGGVLLDSINFDAFNNMIVTGRHLSSDNVGATGNYVDNIILKLPHNGDLIGPIVFDDQYNNVLKRFTYTPASVVRCWEECKYDTGIPYGSGRETYRLLRTTALWNDNTSGATNPTSLDAPTTFPTYNSTVGITTIATLDTGTYANRWLWQAPSTNLQLDPTTNRQFDRADRRSSSSIFLQTIEESDSSSQIIPIASAPAYVYVDQTVNTDNAQTDFDAAVYTKLEADYGAIEDSRIHKQELPNAMVTVSRYWDGQAGIRTQLLTRHSPTGGTEFRFFNTGYNTYPRDVCVDEIGNIYCVGYNYNGSYDEGYVVIYDKDLNLVTHRLIGQVNNAIPDYQDANFVPNCCAVTMNSANTAVLAIGGHYTTYQTGTPTQHGLVAVIPVNPSSPGYLGTSTQSTLTVGGPNHPGNTDTISGIDIIQNDSADNNNLYIGYAGKVFDTTGNTTRGMYGIIQYNGSTLTTTVPFPVNNATNNVGYVIGDDLELDKFRFAKGVRANEISSGSDYLLRFAVAGKETQAGDTNGFVLIGHSRQTTNASTVGADHSNDHPYSVTSFVINNGNGSDFVKDIRWGYVAVPGIEELYADRTTIYNNDYQYFKNSFDDRLYVTCAVTNQFSQVDTVVAEITAANFTNRDTFATTDNNSPDAANLTRVGKISTSGITEPAGICVLGPQYGTIMISTVCANIGTPNDRHLLTAKLPMDMSKKNSVFTEVGSQFIYWDEVDFSLFITGRVPFDLAVHTAAANYDGTRFVWSAQNGTGPLIDYQTAATSPSIVSDPVQVGTFNTRTKDLQQFKQS